MSNTVVPRASSLVVVVAAVIGAAALAVDRPEAAAVSVLVLVGLIAALTAPALVISLPLPLAYAYWRIGPESFDMSVADASLLAATIVALPYVPWRDRRLQRALWVLIAYELMLVIPLVANLTGPALFEWFHRAVLVGGSVLVGGALVRLASLRFALRAFAAASAAVAIVSIVFTFTNGFDPAYPLGLHKNAAGNILAIAVLLGLVTPQLLGLRRWMHVLLEAVLIGGLLSVQSRGSMLAIIVCLCLWALRGRTHRPSMAVTMVLLIVALAATVSLVNEREYERVIADPNAAEFTPERLRRLDYEAALDQWRSEPFTGGGLRYFNTTDASGGEPHNLAILALAEGGLFALVGVIVLLGGTYAVLARVRGPVATIARLAVLVRVLTGTVDVFWVAGRMTVPFVLVGAAIALEAERGRDEAARRASARVSGPPVLRLYHSAVVTPWRARDRALRRAGWNVTTLSPSRWDEGGRSVELERAADEFVEPISTFGSHPFRFAYAPWTLWKALRREPWVALDLHEEPASLAVFEVLLIRWVLRLRTPVLLFCAENLRKRYPPPFRWFERWALGTASAVYCCNTAAAEHLRAKGFLGRLEVIGLGVDVEQFTAADAGPGAHLGYVGRLDERKGVQIAMRALTQLPAPATLTIAGAGSYEPTLRSLAQQLNVDERVRFVSYVANQDLPSLYRSFDLVVVPSLPTPRWEEQFCRVAVEAMASGVPVVASRSGALPEVVGDGGVLAPPGDVAAWSEVLRSILGDASQRQELAERAVCQAQRYSWDVIAEQHAALYEAVTA